MSVRRTVGIVAVLFILFSLGKIIYYFHIVATTRSSSISSFSSLPVHILSRCKVYDSYNSYLLLSCNRGGFWIDTLWLLEYIDTGFRVKVVVDVKKMIPKFYGAGIYDGSLVYVYNDDNIRFIEIIDDRIANSEDVPIASLLNSDTLLLPIEPPYKIKIRDSVIVFSSYDLNFGEIYVCSLRFSKFTFDDGYIMLRSCREFSIGVSERFYEVFPWSFLVAKVNGQEARPKIVSLFEFHNDDVVVKEIFVSGSYIVALYRILWSDWLIVYDMRKGAVYGLDVGCRIMFACYNTVVCKFDNNSVLRIKITGDSLAVAYLNEPWVTVVNCVNSR